MDKYLIPKIQAPAIKPIELDIAPQLLSDVPIPSQINKKESQDDVIKRIKREILNSPKVDFGKIDKQFQDKYVQVTPDELSKVNKGDDITERIKFDENYEAVKSQTQGEWERAGNTAKKFGAAATSTFLGGLATIPNIIGSAINGIGYLSGEDKPISDFFNLGWDSGINKTLSDFVDETNKNNRNYKSNWSKEHWIKDMIPIFGEGGFQEIIASSGYIAGAIAEFFLSGGIASILSKGTKLAGIGGRISKYLNSPEKLDKMIDAFKMINKEDDVRKIIGEAGYMIGKGIEKSPQLYRAYVGAHVEAAFEGLEGAKRFEEEAIKQYKEKNLGMSPDQATLENIKKISQEVGDMRYKLNLAVLTVPNYLQMGALLKTFPGAEKVSKMLAGNKLLGELEATNIKEGMFNVRKASDVKLNWNLDSKIGKYFEKGLEKTITGLQQYGKIPLSFSEGGEEYMQYIIDEYTSSLYKGAYLNPEKAKNVGEYLSQMFSTLSEKGTSKEAAQSFLMGSVGGGIQQTFNTGYELATNSNQLKSKIAANEKIAVELEELSKRMFSNSSLTDTLNDDDKEQLKDILAKSLNQNSITGTLEDKYNNALSALNSLSVMEDVLSSGNIDAQRWYYNIKDRHLSQILHEVVETGKQDVFKQHLNELAKADEDAVNGLYGINISEQTRSHVDFVNDVLNKLNRIESNSKKLDFAFNEQFDDNLTTLKYRQYKGEMSHLKYMIDRQRERRDGLKSTRTDVLNKILSGDYSQLQSRIETLKLVQPDTQDYNEAKKELKRLEDAYKLFKNSTVFNTDGKLETIKTDKLAEALNKLDDVQDNTTKSVFEDLRKVNDIMLLDAYTSDNSPFVKEYKELYREDGFQKYLEKRKEYFEQLDKMFNKDRKEEDVKAKTEELLKDVPEEVKDVVKKEVIDVVAKDLPDEEVKDKVEEIVAENLPPQKLQDVIIDKSVQEKMTFDYPDVEDKKTAEIVTNDVIDNIADFIIIPKEEQEEIKKENTASINDLLEEELQFDESNFFLNQDVPQRSVLTEKEKLDAESMMLQSGKLLEKKQDKVLFEIGKFKVYDNEKSVSSINGKTLTGEQIDEFNKILNPLGWNIVDEEKKGTNSFKVRVNKTLPPTNIPSTSPVSTREDNIDFMQNDFYLNDSAFNKNTKIYNEALLERRRLLNSLKNINDLVWELEDNQMIDLKEKKIDSHTVANGSLLKIHQAPFFTISTQVNGKKVIVQEYRDLRNGWGISKSFLSTLGISIKDSFDFNSEGLSRATNFEVIKKDWVSLYNVVEYLENNNTEKFELLIKQLGLKENILRMSFRRQKLLESGKTNLRLKRIAEEYISSPTVHENSLHSNYIAKERIENLSNNVVIDKDGNQYTAILDVIIPYVQLIEGDGFTNEADKYRQILKDKIDEAKFKGTIENNIPLQLEIKAKLQAQLDEIDSEGNYINSPATFLNNGFNLIFTDSKGRPYVKNLIADVPTLPTSNEMLRDIKADVLVGDVRSSGWFINISGLQEQLGAKFEVVKVGFNKFATEKEDISGISILYLYQDEKGNDNFWRTNYRLSTANNVNTIPYLTKDIKNDIKKHFNEKVDVSKISVNFVKSNKKKPENYDDIIINNPYVIKGIEFENPKNKNDMRNKTTYSFFNDRVEVVEIEKQSDDKDEIVPVPTVTTKTKKEEKPSAKEQKKPIVKDDEQSELIKFFNQFKDVKIGDVKEELIVILPEQYYILEEVIKGNDNLRAMIKETINDEEISLQEKKEESILYLNKHIGVILEKINKCNQ